MDAVGRERRLKQLQDVEQAIELSLAAQSEAKRVELERYEGELERRKEEQEYVDSIEEDVKWLGWDWGENLFFASDYFETLYGYAVQLIEKGLAFVDSQSQEEIREQRGTLTEPGQNSPYRDRSIEENLDLFQRMRAGEFEDGAHVLRAKIDMASPNMNMRDPTLYRIRHGVIHHQTGEEWCI